MIKQRYDKSRDQTSWKNNRTFSLSSYYFQSLPSGLSLQIATLWSMYEALFIVSPASIPPFFHIYRLLILLGIGLGRWKVSIWADKKPTAWTKMKQHCYYPGPSSIFHLDNHISSQQVSVSTLTPAVNSPSAVRKSSEWNPPVTFHCKHKISQTPWDDLQGSSGPWSLSDPFLATLLLGQYALATLTSLHFPLRTFVLSTAPLRTCSLRSWHGCLFLIAHGSALTSLAFPDPLALIATGI